MDETTQGATGAPPAAPPQRPQGGETRVPVGAGGGGVAAPPRRVAAKRPARRRGVAVNDPVADMLTRVRNAVGARHETLELPTSRIRAEIARILKAEGFITSFESSGGQLTIRLKYLGKVAALTGVRRISRPGLRAYARRTEMPRVLGGLGVAIVSTSAGVMTGREARRKGLGGEVLAHVW